jgi:hypothetical protein
VGEFLGGGGEGTVSTAISVESGPEVGEQPGGGVEESVASMAISCKPGPEVGEPSSGGE